ncbi:MAG: type I-C CRISPR-associated protein Cas7/Csd2 [Propionicimonas sp.]|uniref:type I-C CRISPR-associated protein Cas7/Csd2 n=1 Tax=Propionicimonas sp. TaxID=1955623 RepID=UPI003D1483CC
MSDAHLNPAVKHDALFVFDAIDSNPNGDPDNAGKPRTDLDTGQGVVSDASLKRKIRDTVQFQVDQGMLAPERYGIFIRRGVSLNEQLEEAYRQLRQPLADAKNKNSAEQIENAAGYMIDRYFDVRCFGAVMSTGQASAGKVTGPVTVGLGRSFDPVLPMEMGITRTASTKEEAKDNASQMGSKSVVPYGLYAARVHYQPTRNNQVTAEDLQVLWRSLISLFEVTRSAARPDVNTRGVFVFSHDSALGSAPARSLLDKVVIQRVDLADTKPPTRFEDYVITEPTDLPPGVTYVRLA